MAPHKHTQFSSLPKSAHSSVRKSHNLHCNPLWCTLGRRTGDGVTEELKPLPRHPPEASTVLTFETLQDTIFCDSVVLTTPSYSRWSHSPALDPKPYPNNWAVLLALSPYPYHPHHRQGAKKETCRNQARLSSLIEGKSQEFYSRKGRPRKQEEDQEIGRAHSLQRNIVWGGESTTSQCH